MNVVPAREYFGAKKICPICILAPGNRKRAFDFIARGAETAKDAMFDDKGFKTNH